jgi:formate/nitrite transporter FocA (FNT family)
MQAGGATQQSYLMYRVKRQLKILLVCAGIAVVSISIGLICALELTTYAASHQKDPAMAGRFSLALAMVLLIGGIAAFMAAVWRVEHKARQERLTK